MLNETLLDHFRFPRNAGVLDAPAVTVEVENPVCGDILQLSALFQDGKVAAARFRARGCTAAMAAGSALTEWMLGHTPADLTKTTSSDLDDVFGGLSNESKHVATLCRDAIRRLAGASAVP